MPRVAQRHSKCPRIQEDEGNLEMKKIRRVLGRFLTGSDGFETVEYGIMTSMIIIGIVAALVLMMVTITDTFANTATLMN